MDDGQLSSKHLLGIQNLTPDDIQLIFRTADEFKDVLNRPIKKVPSLRDVTIANLFFENSTRTKLSFELASLANVASGGRFMWVLPVVVVHRRPDGVGAPESPVRRRRRFGWWRTRGLGFGAAPHRCRCRAGRR